MRNDDATAATGEARPVNPPNSHILPRSEAKEILGTIYLEGDKDGNCKHIDQTNDPVYNEDKAIASSEAQKPEDARSWIAEASYTAMFSPRNEAQRNEAPHLGVKCEEPEILPGVYNNMPGRRSQPRAPTAGGSSLGARKNRTVDETVRCKAEDEFDLSL